MTSEVQGARKDDPAPTLPDTGDEPPCLCCLHFAVDFESMPEALKSKRPSRHPKRPLNPSV